jgi:hypothetical protein
MATVAKVSLINSTFAPMSARRLLIFGGIALVACGMLFGDIFAVFIRTVPATRALDCRQSTVTAGDEARNKISFRSGR